MARVEGGAVTIITDWPGLKELINTRNLNFRFEEDDVAYEIFAIDGQYFYTATIYKAGKAPDNQATYDTYRAEFEADYKYKITDFNATEPFFLTNQDGYSVVLKDGNAPTSNDGYGIAVIGIDGSNYRMLKMDTSGRPVMVGAGTAGSPVGGLITIQGDPSGTPLPISGSITVSGTVTANQGTANTAANGWPVKITDGTNILGTSGDPIRIDPTGTTTQPISGTVTANAGTGNFAVVQATAALLNATVTANGNFNNASVSATAAVPPASATYIGGSVTTASPTYTNGNMNALSLTTAGALRIDGSAVTQPISGTVTANAGTGTFSISGTVTSNQGTSPWVNNITQFGGSNVVTGTGTSGAGIPRVTVSNDSNILATQSGTWTVAQGTAAALSGAWPVKVTDGTNTMPTMDAAARAGYMRITDGTNTLGTLFNTLHADPNGDRRTIHNNATITSSSSTVLTWVGWSEWYLVVNLKNAPTGTSPTIQFKVEQVDPIDQTTVLTGVRVFTGTVMTAAGVDIIEIPELVSDAIKISWTVTGASASWTGVNVTFCGHGAGNAIEGQADVGTIADDPPVPVAGVDQDGYIQYLNVDGSGNLRVVTQTAPSNVDNGLNAGYAKLGGGTSGVVIPVLSTTYTEQSSNAQRSMSSSSANDTSAGTGARTVEITYYTATFTGPFTEIVTLNGTAAVNTTNTNICYIESMVVKTVGSNGTNVGTITLFASTGGAGGSVASIGANTLTGSIGDSRTLYAQHYVPSGKTCFITGFLVSSSTTTSFFLKTKDLTVANAAEQIITGVIPTSNPFERIYGTPLEVVGPARIVAYAIPSANNATISASIDYYDQ